ncbi:hypothetical protein [Peredibacter starrii]|uniref:Uncharacterized protein n=1 Tax=Peredibacter starrii TaxID=28202 RepID=A0AAX4HM54_9BACT|nr:hypothetical protein [Peredibacter starrii]WPU64348.1 hypothetical protein SOO65_16760 [Peredibacter starrii]
MKTFILFTIFLSLTSFAAEDPRKKMDYGDKQLLQRDVCRKPIEYLQTRYPDFTKEQLEKMKSECKY